MISPEWVRCSPLISLPFIGSLPCEVLSLWVLASVYRFFWDVIFGCFYGGGGGSVRETIISNPESGQMSAGL